MNATLPLAPATAIPAPATMTPDVAPATMTPDVAPATMTPDVAPATMTTPDVAPATMTTPDVAPATMTTPDVAVVVASNDPGILGRNLLRSPAIAGGAVGLHVERDPVSAASAYNRGLDATAAGIVVFAHHDVYLPAGWERLLARRIAEVAALDPDWALIGAFGVGAADGRGYGPVWSSSIGQVLGRVGLAPTPAQSFDELLIVMRRAAGLRFDERLAGFHFYGADIVQTALAAGRSAWIAPLPLVHNDRAHDRLGPDYASAYHALRRKWRARLPVVAPTIKISWHGLHLVRAMRHLRRAAPVVRAQAVPTDVEPERYAERCGWTRLDAEEPGRTRPGAEEPGRTRLGAEEPGRTRPGAEAAR
jgi:hypothetical protein